MYIIKSSTWQIFTTTKSTMKTSFPWEILIKAMMDSNNGSKQDKANNVWISQTRLRFNLVWTIEGLFYDILTINLLYLAKTCYKRSNIDIHHVLAFFKIFSPFVFIIKKFSEFQMSLGGAWKIGIQWLEQFLWLPHHGLNKQSFVLWTICKLCI